MGYDFFSWVRYGFIPQSSDLARLSSGQVALGIPNKPDFIRLPKGKADKIIACGVNLQKILDIMELSFFTSRENLFYLPKK